MGIVVGYRATPEGKAALKYALELAAEKATRLIVVSANRKGPSPADNQELQDLLNGSGVDHELMEIVGDYDPAEEILEAASEQNAELVVIGMRRRTPVGKLFMGSTAQRILLEAECPVLAIKANRH
ncbi:universal stress protein [Arthrobacter roseus]|uniref:universal stress protein n=1 Tax=Arthrobacter roseus TaxID=136274 RepID=UPI0019640D02|nr:universal stress protein [Arthrobacter roseus]MBM7849669.1 nucleotide-binding universal stress UspA family protein [Arthrobacter roseus]